MKSLELMKSIEAVELIGLIESNQVNKKFTTCALFLTLFQ